MVKARKVCYIMGDMNFNLNDETQSFTDAFIEAMFDHSFHSLINKPTRITDTSATYIDHIRINCPITSVVITHLITDQMLWHNVLSLMSQK